MEDWKSVSKKRLAFTIVELLTVMGVIAILISLLVPALGLVKDFAKEIQQKAQFHSIEVAIDMFATNSGYGTYPPSDENGNLVPPPGPLGPDLALYGGAQKLAEALVGWDLMGYHPESLFRSDGLSVNAAGTATYLVYTGSRPNLEARKGPFIDLENANAFTMGDIYANPGSFDPTNYVLCDVYAKKRHTSKRTGMPILYYRARTEYFNQDSTDAANIDDDIYYYRDNMDILSLGTPENGTPHILDGTDVAADWLRFEEIILNDEIATVNRPYRANSYILISAGKDGIYGTGDDLMNFTKE